MPTGYTCAIKDGISFQQFALGCARAFGACITMRDDPSDAQIPDKFEPSTHYAKLLQDANNKLAELEALTPQECEDAALKEYLDGCEQNAVRRQEYADLRMKYEAMLACAQEWVPPTPEHQGLKDFMIQQISESIRFDCNDEYITAPTKKSGAVWLSEQIKSTKKRIASYAEENDQEIERARSRTDWVNALRNSLAIKA
jgi:hypothetical protein